MLGSCLWPTISESIPSRNKSNLKREPGAIYLEDFSEDKVELLAIKQEPIYVSPQRKRAIGQLRKGKKVTLIAMTNKQYLIRGMALHGQVKGWIPPSALQELNKDFSDKLRALYERKKVVDELIKNKQIALGMNTGEVVESMGKPSRKNSKLDRGGRLDTYEYSTFERVAQYRFRRDSQGNLFRQKYYVKMETGKLSVTFKNDIVESIEETEGNPLGGGDLKIVPIPIELF
ncbi:MAG: hypothetical protein CMO37_03065 [Verrucomicrobiaceae bacterium]|nr:hypothetical protein [Verrucomicrobiaceae bacterium]